MTATQELMSRAETAETAETAEAAAAASSRPQAAPSRDGEVGETLAPLFAPDAAAGFRSRWDAVQIGFVDDPRRAVAGADQLVTQVVKDLSATFADEHARLEAQMNDTDANGAASTEGLRVALRRYRSLFQRLLAL